MVKRPWVKIQTVPPIKNIPIPTRLKWVVHLPQNDTSGFDPQTLVPVKEP